MPGDRVTDPWTQPDQGVCTKGFTIVMGAAGYRHNKPLILGFAPAVENEIPSRPTPEPIADIDSNVLNRGLIATWDCCDGNKNPTNVTTFIQ